MRAALLFCGARHTAYCQQAVQNAGFSLTHVRAADAARLPGELAAALEQACLLLLLGPQDGGSLCCARQVYELLGVPLEQGQPQGVRLLAGGGVLVRGVGKAVALLPDTPQALARLLPQVAACAQEWGLA